MGIVTGIALLYGLLVLGQPLIASRFGLFIGINGLSIYELIMVGIVCVAGFLIGIIPGYRVYQYSLVDGMTVKL